MAYTPMTADEAAKLSLREEGVYAFEVLEAKEGLSKANNAMIALELRFFDNDGSGGSFKVKDWLVHSDSRWAEKKFFDFANSTGIQARYSSGQMTADDCLGRSGYAMVGVQAGKPKDDGSGNFPDRNVVKYYTTKPVGQSAPTAAAKTGSALPSKAEEDFDSVPF